MRGNPARRHAHHAGGARIQCHGNFQVIKYGLIATPYCEEVQIAFVARSYGQWVTAAEVHSNPLTKVYLCQTIGYDLRLKGSPVTIRSTDSMRGVQEVRSIANFSLSCSWVLLTRRFFRRADAKRSCHLICRQAMDKEECGGAVALAHV